MHQNVQFYVNFQQRNIFDSGIISEKLSYIKEKS